MEKPVIGCRNFPKATFENDLREAIYLVVVIVNIQFYY